MTDDEHATLTDRARRPATAQRPAPRAKIVLAATAGGTNAATAAELRLTVPTVRKWRDRFARARSDELADEPRSGAPRTITDPQG